jgi:hypothetical protein
MDSEADKWMLLHISLKGPASQGMPHVLRGSMSTAFDLMLLFTIVTLGGTFRRVFWITWFFLVFSRGMEQKQSEFLESRQCTGTVD